MSELRKEIMLIISHNPPIEQINKLESLFQSELEKQRDELTKTMYSEEDMKEAYMEGGDCDSQYKTFYEWFNQFKKK